MPTPVIAIGLDAAEPRLIEEWVRAGRLPNLSRMLTDGGYGRLTNLDHYMAETPWTTFLTGCLPANSGYWSPLRLLNGTYDVRELGAYDYSRAGLFYELGDSYRVAAFDVPQARLSPAVNGPQVLAWGAHSPQVPSTSLPQDLFARVNAQFGDHPALHRDHGEWWDDAYLSTLRDRLLCGIERRTAVCRDWLAREPLDLFLTVFSETHSAGHDFWHLSRLDSPLFQRDRAVAHGDSLLKIYTAVDAALGEILAAAPTDSYRVVFSVHGMGHVTDIASMVLLPEFLYRHSFPGQQMLAPGRIGAPLPPVVQPRHDDQGWAYEVWEHCYDPNPLRRLMKTVCPASAHRRITRTFGGPVAPDLLSPADLKARGKDLVWQPAQWYCDAWPRMKAFALPTFSEGYVRINLKGRDPEGIVEPAEYDALCTELSHELHQLINPRSGGKLVDKIIRTRASAAACDPRLPDADLIVIWTDESADAAEHRKYGRIGPVPYRRAGTHRPRGFWAIQGPGIAAGTRFPTAHAVDLTATILSMMGAPIPQHLDGTPIIDPVLNSTPAMSNGA